MFSVCKSKVDSPKMRNKHMALAVKRSYLIHRTEWNFSRKSLCLRYNSAQFIQMPKNLGSLYIAHTSKSFLDPTISKQEQRPPSVFKLSQNNKTYSKTIYLHLAYQFSSIFLANSVSVIVFDIDIVLRIQLIMKLYKSRFFHRMSHSLSYLREIIIL